MKKLLVSVGVIALGACSANSPFSKSFNSEAGQLVSDDFGNATMNNTQIQSGEKSFVLDLSNRFANDVASTVNFEFNSARLDAGAQETLREQAKWIRQFPEVRFRVYGHADAVGSNAFNKSLGMRRARAVVAYLATQGISTSRLEAVVSYGETQPLIVTQGRERRNRRTVTEVSGFVKSHPSVLDGKYAQIVYREYIESATTPTGLSGISGRDLKTDG
jgi:outer membrane protein OmpA-like peptidoglycan-associated protein